MSDKLQFLLEGARIVQGSPTFRQTTDMSNRVKDKPNWFFAAAVPKNSPTIGNVLNQILGFAWHGYSQHPQIQQRINLGPAGGFAFKIVDGDDPQVAGKEGFAGCWVFKYSTTIGVPPCFNTEQFPIDPETIKCGYYVDVSTSVAINGNTDHTAGIYMNPVGVMLIGYGPEIISGPSPQQMFGSRSSPVQLPAGASATPVGPGRGQPQQPAGFGGQPQQQPAGGFQQPAPASGFGGQPQQPQQSGGFVPQQAAPAQNAAGFGGQPQQPQTAAYPSNQAPAGFSGAAPAQAAPAFSGGQAQQPAASAAPFTQAGTASPSNYPNAQPHPGFANGGQQ